MIKESMDEILKRMREEEAKRGEEGKAYLLSLVPQLVEAEAKLLVVHYDGEGDSGSIQWIAAFKNEDAPFDEYYEGRTGKKFDLAYLPGLEPDHESKMHDKVDEAACGVLEGLNINWYDNEGGLGYVVLDVATGKISVKHSARINDTVDSEHEV